MASAALQTAAGQGEGSDTGLAHVAHGDVVVPHEIITPDVHLGLQKLFAAKNRDKDRFTVGHKNNRINPKTGLPGFDGGENSGTEGPGGGDNTDPGGNGTGGSNNGLGSNSDTPGVDNGASGDPTDVTGAVTGPVGNIGTNTTANDQLSAGLADQQGRTDANVAAGGHGFGIPGVETEVGNTMAPGVDSTLYGFGFDTQNPGRSVATMAANALLSALLGPEVGLVNQALGIGTHAATGYTTNFGSLAGQGYDALASSLSHGTGTPGDIGGGGESGPGNAAFGGAPDLAGTAFNQPVGNSVGTPVVQSSSPTTAAAAPESNFGTGIDDIVRRAGLA